MTYALHFQGNLPSKSHDEGHAKEAEVMKLAAKFAEQLEEHGLLQSHMQGTHIGSVPDLRKPDQIFNPTH